MTNKGRKISDRLGSISQESWHLVVLGMFISLSGGIFSFGFVLMMQNLGHDTAFQGYMMSLMEVVVAATILPFGVIAPRIGKRSTLVIGLLSTAASYGIISVAGEIYHFMIAMVFLGLGNSMIAPTLAAAAADSVCDEDRKYLMSINAFCSMLASAFGFLISGVVVHLMGEVSGFRTVFQVAFGTMLAAAMLLTRKIEAKCGPPARIRTGARKILPFVLPQFVLGLGAGLVIPFFPVYFKLKFDAGAAAISTLFALTQVVWAFSYIAMPLVAERAGSVKTLIIMQSLAVFALFVIPFSFSFESAAVLFAVRMILMNASRPIADSYMMTLIGKDLRSTAVAANQMAWMVPHMISVAAGGILMRSNLELPFFICGVMYIISSGLYAYFFMKRDDV